MFTVYFWTLTGEQTGECATFSSYTAAKQYVLNTSNWPTEASEATFSDDWHTTVVYKEELE